MLKVVLSVYDSKTGIYYPPMFFVSIPEAVRAFTSLANDPNSQISLYPEDFALFTLGTFDDCTGKFKSTSDPVSLGLAQDFLNRVKPKLSDVSPEVMSIATGSKK